MYTVCLSVSESGAEDQAANSTWYQNFGVESVEVTVGSRVFKTEHLDFDLGGNFNAMQCYFDTVARGLDRTSGFSMGYRDFMNIATVFVYDVTRSGHSASCPDLENTPEGSTDYSVHCKFGSELKDSVSLKVVTEYRRVLELGQNGGVTFS